jgi:hypothetical protein
MASANEKPNRSSEEKTIGDAHLETTKHVHTIENLPDPDAGLSEEERAAHVCRSAPISLFTNHSRRTRDSSESSTSN